MNLLSTLATMLTYCRPHGSAVERTFRGIYIRSLPGAYTDPHGNVHVIVGDAPIIYSCHTDTVHRAEGRQTVHIAADGTISLSKRSRRRSSCLGADDTIGVFLMREMVLAGVPGRYIFHYGEECGCIGSRDLADAEPDMLSTYKAAIAFDRMGTTDIITHQLSRRTCSDAFASALADQLNASTPGFTYVPSDRGMYTDTESYSALIPECTNVSIGYAGAHGNGELVDSRHVLKLRDALVRLDTSVLPIERNPADRVSLWSSFDSWDKYDALVDVDDDGRPIYTDDDAYEDDEDDRSIDHAMYLNPEFPSIQRTIERMSRLRTVDDDDRRSWWQVWPRKGRTQ